MNFLISCLAYRRKGGTTTICIPTQDFGEKIRVFAMRASARLVPAKPYRNVGAAGSSWPAPFLCSLAAFFEQALERRTLHVHVHRRPILLVNHGDEALNKAFALCNSPCVPNAQN